MSLATNVSDLATRAASEDKAIRTLVNGNAADNAALTTTAKANLVVAINEVKASVSSAAGINDTTPSTSSTYSSSKTDSQIAAASTTDRARANHTGTQTADTITDGTTNKAYTAAEKTKLAGVATSATANSSDATLLARANHTGTQPSTTISDFTEGVQDVVGAFVTNGTNITKTYDDTANTLTISTSATVNATDSALRDRSTHTGTQSADSIVDGTTNKVLSAANATKLTGIASGATANDTDANLKARANHTGTQLAATISDFAGSVDARIESVLDVSGAPAAINTLNELAAAIGDDPTYAATVTTALGNRVRFDASQTLTGPQQAQARTNIGAALASDVATLAGNVGDTTTNFVTVFEAGLV